MDPRATVAVGAGAHLEEEGAVDLVLLGTEDTRQIFSHCEAKLLLLFLKIDRCSGTPPYYYLFHVRFHNNEVPKYELERALKCQIWPNWPFIFSLPSHSKEPCFCINTWHGINLISGHRLQIEERWISWDSEKPSSSSCPLKLMIYVYNGIREK